MIARTLRSQIRKNREKKAISMDADAVQGSPTQLNKEAVTGESAANTCWMAVVVGFTADTRRRLVCAEGDTEPHIQVAARRCAREAKRRAANLRNALSPATATHNPNSVPFITHGIFGTQGFVGS